MLRENFASFLIYSSDVVAEKHFLFTLTIYSGGLITEISPHACIMYLHGIDQGLEQLNNPLPLDENMQLSTTNGSLPSSRSFLLDRYDQHHRGPNATGATGTRGLAMQLNRSTSLTFPLVLML